MKLYSDIVIDIETCQCISRVEHEYFGPVALCKGGNSQSEMDKANQLSQQQLGIMQSQLAMQQKQLGMVNPSLQAILQNRGMLPEQEAAMRTQAMQGLGGQYKSLEGQLSQQLAARGITGGANAGGGDIARSFGSLGAMEAGQQSDLLNQIQLAKGQGLNNAIGLGLGEGAMFGNQALGFGGQGVSALGSGVTAANNADQASTGFWGSMIGGLAGVGSAAITKCWVAAELYGGWYSPEAIAIREWLDENKWMRPFTYFYGRYGKAWARSIRTRPWLRRQTRRLFNYFLSRANA